VFCSFVGLGVIVSSFDIRILDFRVFGERVKYGVLSQNFKLPFLGTELLRQGTQEDL